MGYQAKPLKCLHSEQLSRIQAKNQQECDLLEDIRGFTKQRTAIEKTYAEAILKLSSAYLHRKLPQLPELPSDGENKHCNVFTVWKTLLEETEKLSKARLAAVDIYQQRIVEDAKTLRTNKVQTSKRCLEQLQNVQKELQGCVQELDNCKKRYMDEEHVAHEAREKATVAEEKLKKKKGFFTSFSSLQKNSAKLSAKKEQFEEKSTAARNSYLLQLGAAKAHQERYFNVDLQYLLRTMEGDTFEKVAEYLLLFGRTELFTCSASQASFVKIRDQAQCIDPAYNVECYTTLYPAIAQNLGYKFEPCENDQVHHIVVDKYCKAELDEEAQKWASRSVKESKLLRECNKRLAVLQDYKNRGERTDPQDPAGTDIDVRIDEVKNVIRQSETSISKCQARIQILKDGGVNVDELMKQLDVSSLSVEDPLCRSGSQFSMREQYHEDDSDANETTSPVHAVASSYDSDRNYSNDYDDDTEIDREVSALQSRSEEQPPGGLCAPGDWGDIPTTPVPPAPTLPGVQSVWSPDPWEGSQGTADDSLSEVQSGPQATPVRYSEQLVPGAQCYAIYSYQAQNNDELTIMENEVLHIIEDGDGDGWLRARNQDGHEGLVPHNYIEAIAAEGETAGAVEGNTDAVLESINSVEVVVGDESLAKTISISESNNTVLSGDIYCRALYDYDATSAEELSLNEDDVVLVLRTIGADGVDDGWWEGRLGDKVGLFPSLVVEQCHADGEPLTPESEGSASVAAIPPGFTPPEAPDHVLPGGVSPKLEDPNLTGTKQLQSTDSVEEQSDSVFADSSADDMTPAPVPVQTTSTSPPSSGEQPRDDTSQEVREGTTEVEVQICPEITMESDDKEESSELPEEKEPVQKPGTMDVLDFAEIVVTAPTPSTEHPPTSLHQKANEPEAPQSTAASDQVVEDEESAGVEVYGADGEEFDVTTTVSACRVVHTPATPPDTDESDQEQDFPQQEVRREKEPTPPTPPSSPAVGQSADEDSESITPPTKNVQSAETAYASSNTETQPGAQAADSYSSVPVAESGENLARSHAYTEDDDQMPPEELEPIHLVKLENMIESDA